jgi:hypothetical protein
MSRSRHRKANSGSSEKRRPGRRSNFQGERLQLLESFLPDWEKARLHRTTGDFWSAVTSAYWERFHWRLPQDEEPSHSGDAPMDEALTEEELRQKAAAIRLVEKACFFSPL